MLSLQIEPIEQVPVDSEMANIHFRLTGTNDLQLLAHAEYLKAAAEYVEGQTQRSLTARKHIWILPRFPYASGALMLPRGKCQSIESITYYDNSGPVVLRGPSSGTPGTDYQEDLGSDTGGMVKPLVGESWPSVDREYIKPIEIEYTAGWQGFGNVPAGLRNAVMVAAAQYLENPEGAYKDMDVTLPDRLLSPFKLVTV